MQKFTKLVNVNKIHLYMHIHTWIPNWWKISLDTKNDRHPFDTAYSVGWTFLSFETMRNTRNVTSSMLFYLHALFSFATFLHCIFIYQNENCTQTFQIIIMKLFKITQLFAFCLSFSFLRLPIFHLNSKLKCTYTNWLYCSCCTCHAVCAKRALISQKCLWFYWSHF